MKLTIEQAPLNRGYYRQIVEDEQDVRRSLGRFLRREGPPIGFGIADIELDIAFEVLVGPHGLGSSTVLLSAARGVRRLRSRPDECKPEGQREESES
jgi:hypothetical protein